MRAPKFLDHILLPPEITQFERDYLTRMNRVALVFFWLHPPVFALVAFLCGTSVLRALLYPIVVLAGPTLAHRAFTNPRLVSMVYGVTAMCMGGLLVHFGQGPMQIEMHFYFFVLLALEAVFANPMVVIVSAVTVALHHTILFALLPRSVFNYDASIWTVVVHALFVVLESVAACFVARSFFDNVIGLDRIVKARTRALDVRNADMRMVLENVGQGFLTVDRDGKMSAERSAVVSAWFGAAPEASTFVDYIAWHDATFAAWFRLGLDAVLEDFLPLELALEQMPRRLTVGPSTWDFAYRPILADGRLEKLLLVVTDLTGELARERAEIERRELADVMERAMKDGDAVVEFLAEGDGLAALIQDPSLGRVDRLRALHTLKGNAALFGVASVAAACHDAETEAQEHGDVTSQDRETVRATWSTFRARMEPFVRVRSGRVIALTEEDHARFVASVVEGAPRAQLVRHAVEWTREPADLRFTRIADQVAATARRLGKPAPEVELDTAGLRLPRDSWTGFWSAFVHAVRNALDHGLETSEERVSSGKSERGHIKLSARQAGDRIEIALSDDGRGIDWEGVRERASAKGLPHETAEELLSALFVDGITTKDEVSDVSGRGVGMGALRTVCAELGGDLELHSIRGLGTTVRIRLPRGEDTALLSRIVPANDSLPPRRGPMFPMKDRRASVR